MKTAEANNAPVVSYADPLKPIERINKGKSMNNSDNEPDKIPFRWPRIPHDEFSEQFMADMSDEWIRTPIIGEVDSKTGKITINHKEKQ